MNYLGLYIPPAALVAVLFDLKHPIAGSFAMLGMFIIAFAYTMERRTFNAKPPRVRPARSSGSFVLARTNRSQVVPERAD